MKNTIMLTIAMILFTSFGLAVNGQTSTVITTGLDHSTKVIHGHDGTLLIADSGTMMPNTGRNRSLTQGNGSVLVPVVITPTSMARDDVTGDLFVTNIFPGTLTRIHF